VEKFFGLSFRDGNLDRGAFLEKLALAYKYDAELQGRLVERDPWAHRAVAKIARWLKRGRKRSASIDDPGQGMVVDRQDLLTLFHEIDDDNNGIISVEEFQQKLPQLEGFNELTVDGELLSSSHLRRIADYVDISGNGAVSLVEFLSAFHVSDSFVDTMDSSSDLFLAETITTTLFRARTTVLAGCQFFDAQRTGAIDPENFEDVLDALVGVLNSSQTKFTEDQVRHLIASCTRFGRIHYLELLNAFEVVDSRSGGKEAATIVPRESLRAGGIGLGLRLGF
jgi:Ca2+-binding EF-hand superfamily protein